MAHFLLIHGSCHGAWCWDSTIPALEVLGHSAHAIDLPGHGADPTPPEDVTLDDYARAIDDALTPGTILVGHSMAGYAITAAAERASGKIGALVYLAAYVPIPGKTLGDMRRTAPVQPLIEAIRVSEDRKTWTPDPALGPSKFYQDVPEDIAAAAMARLTPEPILPQETPLWPEHAFTLPRHYIRCEDDNAVPTVLQHMMTENWTGGEVLSLPGSHSPFLARPGDLAAALGRLAG